MKRFMFFIMIVMFVCVVNNSNSQTIDTLRITKVEKMVVDNVNKYRSSKGLSKLSWSNDLYATANHHGYYITQVSKITHDEFQDIPNFVEIPNFNDRSEYYSPETMYSSELIVMTPFIENKTEQDRINLAKELLGLWISSKPHNESLLDPKFNYCGVSVFINNVGTVKSVMVLGNR